MSIQQFRNAIHQVMTRRANAALDLIDALTIAGHVESPVALSEEPPFRRVFSSVYDVLEEAELDQEALAKVLYEAQPPDSETIAGYEVYAVDTTPNERPQAKTLPDRTQLKASKDEPVRVGHKYSWLARLVTRETSWVAPQDVCRVKSDTTDNQTAVEQVKALDQRSNRLKVIVADSLYGNVVFPRAPGLAGTGWPRDRLAVFLIVTTVAALVRLRHNLVLPVLARVRATGAQSARFQGGAAQARPQVPAVRPAPCARPPGECDLARANSAAERLARSALLQAPCPGGHGVACPGQGGWSSSRPTAHPATSVHSGCSGLARGKWR